MIEDRTIEVSPSVLNKTQREIIRAALYFDVFSYPLTVKELFENSAVHISFQEFKEELNQLIKDNFLQQKGEFVLSLLAEDHYISRRIKGNKGAEAIMPMALKYSRKIAGFPFVEGVFLSGSLSKKYYDDKSDIDYFITTKPGRLWICRSLLILRYKLTPSKEKKFWCVNYFISSDNLVIPDANNFTATELAHLIPTVNYPLYCKMLDQNQWYKAKLPNKENAANVNCLEAPNTRFKRFVSFLLSGRFGDWIDAQALQLTLSRWRKKFPDMSDEDFELQFRSRKNACKRHTHGFQNKVLQLWKDKIREYELKFNANLN